MPILDLHADDLGTAALNTRTEPPKTAEPGIFKGFAEGTGRYFMRGMAEAGRAASMAIAAVPVAVQKTFDTLDPDGAISDRRMDDSYFKWHDETFNRAVDYWTPKPGDVGAAGQVVGSLAAGVTQFLANPALMIGTQQLSVSEDLVRQGVDVGAALVAGDIAGLGAVAGVKIPILGKTLGQRVGAGVAGNLGQGVATAAATQGVLKAAEAPAAVRAQFDPWDVRNRTVDALMGVAFGAMARGSRPQQLSQTQRDAIMLVNQARHLEEASSPGLPADAAIDNTRRALDQMLRGEPVSVDAVPHETVVDPAKDAYRAETRQVVEAEMTREAPIERPPEPVPAAPPEPPKAEPSPFRTAVDEIAPLMVGKEPGQPPPSERADDLRAMGRAAYWAEEGGKMIRAPLKDGEGMEGAVVGRTKWIPAEEWFGDMRRSLGKGGLTSQKAIQAAIEKAIAGEPMKPKEQATVDYIRHEAELMRAEVGRYAPEAPELATAMMEEGLSSRDVPDAAAMRRAAEVAPETYIKASDDYDLSPGDPRDTERFHAAVRDILANEDGSAPPGSPGEPAARTSGKGDLAQVSRVADAPPGKEPGQTIAELKQAGKLTPLANNVVVGLTEAGGDATRVDALVAHAEALAKQAPGRPQGDVMADAIDRMRLGEAPPEPPPKQAPPRFADDVVMPDGRKANDYVAAAQAEEAAAKSTAKNLLTAVANCLLGGA